KPLHNFFFTRDSSISVLDEVLIGKMANKVRERESIIMEAIFKYHPLWGVKTCNPTLPQTSKSNLNMTIEGGDVLVARDDILIIGTGCRTSTQGIDFLIDSIKARNGKTRHILVKELPDAPESFIHLDMVFTFLDRDSCMVFEPLMLQKNKYQTIHITIENGTVSSIRNEGNLLKALKRLGIDLNPISCGGNNDSWIQEREQWHSGANFFAFAPGKVIGYERNVHTLEEMNKNGFEIIKADDVISGQINPFHYNKCVVTIAGSELARGGGGARCMTMPLRRKNVEW
ncbi:MAG: arginine deiminase family protein, partial [Bacteroidota bacterium]|nr:arginine deiminase family protein [Bacteroidota bacterium]